VQGAPMTNNIPSQMNADIGYKPRFYLFKGIHQIVS
jgi:hypothetical protein